MILYINTILNDEIVIAIKNGDKILVSKKISSPHQQAEKLLPEIDGLLKKSKIKLGDLKGIEVENRGGSFTSLRIGVITANALGYALGIPVTPIKQENKKTLKQKLSFDIIKPIYDREPNITIKKK
jgi:tRNA threonylcarbamoyl adenosine modification protein YeaZ